MTKIQSKNVEWHTLSKQKVFASLETDIDRGLSESEASSRTERFGKNSLPSVQKESVFMKFIKHFHDMLIYILLVSPCVSSFMGHYVDAIVIALVVVINAMIGFIQENNAEKAMASILNILALKARVLRKGIRKEISAEDLVPGDIVFLKPGDKIPADMRLVCTANLRVEESMLTGESISSEKSAEDLGSDVTLGDKRNMAFAGTTVSAGTATAFIT